LKKAIVVKKLGSGGFGNVYKGILFSNPDYFVAIKEVPLNQGSNVDAITKEVDLLMQLDHKYIIRGFESWVEGGCVYIAQELAEKDLNKYLNDNGEVKGKMDPRNIAFHIASGMAYLHKNGIVHRDLKSANVLIVKGTNGMVCKIADFGLANDDANFNFEQGLLTLSGSRTTVWMSTKLGTPEFMAPEVFLAPKYTKAVDVYSFGILLFEIVTKRSRRMYPACKNWVDIAEHVLAGNRPRFTVAEQKQHPQLCRLAVACWNPDPYSRPSFSDVVSFLMRVGDYKIPVIPPLQWEYLY